MKKRKLNKYKKLYFKTLLIVLTVGLVVSGSVLFTNNFLNGIKRYALDEENLNINQDLNEKTSKQEIINVAFFGIDTRNNDNVGLSDAILVVSIDKDLGKIKITSIARDTYVDIPGRAEKTKINHAYSYGGPSLAIATINQNFGLNISDYATVNFSQLAEIIDIMGGVSLEITEDERKQINAYKDPSAPKVTEIGLVNLTGHQAVSYSRIRKIGGDDERTNRQRKVLSCLFEKAKKISPLEIPSYIKKFMPMVTTSLTNEELIKLAPIGISGGYTLEQAAFPNEYLPGTGETINDVWYYVYDTGLASEMLHKFIYEDIAFGDANTETTSPETAN